jgi:hypothetical protein
MARGLTVEVFTARNDRTGRAIDYPTTAPRALSDEARRAAAERQRESLRKHGQAVELSLAHIRAQAAGRLIPARPLT